MITEYAFLYPMQINAEYCKYVINIGSGIKTYDYPAEAANALAEQGFSPSDHSLSNVMVWERYVEAKDGGDE